LWHLRELGVSAGKVGPRLAAPTERQQACAQLFVDISKNGRPVNRGASRIRSRRPRMVLDFVSLLSAAF